MNISTKLTLLFSVIVASILILFSIAVYSFHATYRKEEFYTRLENRAMTTARLLVTVQEVDKNLLRIIDRNTIYALPREKVLVFDRNNRLIYSSLEDLKISHTINFLNDIRSKKLIRGTVGDMEQVGVLYQEGGDDYVIIATAYDRFGISKLRNLRTVLITWLIVGIIIIVLAGRWFARQALMPLARLNQQISTITAGSLDKRAYEGNRMDEIAKLAMNFNLMLERLEKAFQMQKSFVSNASHELRTPLATMRSQLQVALENERTKEEYKSLLQSLLEDIKGFSKLTSGLLALARSGMDVHQLKFTPLRIDDILFSAQEELANMQPDYQFHLDYTLLPDNDKDLIVNGNEQLLSTALINFMDNACKFSKDKSVQISLACKDKMVEIRFADKGIGIPESEIEKIFSPFYRGGNAKSFVKGHGIGLSLCQKIIEMHGGKITVQSQENSGTTFIAVIPILQL